MATNTVRPGQRAAISINDAAETLGVHPRTIRRMIADGRLPAVRLGARTIRIPLDALERLISGEVA